MSTLKEKVFERITEDFRVLSKVVIKQIDLTYQLAENNRTEDLYTEIHNNERIIDSIEVKIRDEVINTIVLYSPRASNLRKIIAYYDMTAYLERIGDLIVNISSFLNRTDIHGELFGKYKNDLLNMLSLAENMTQNAIFAFTCEDNKLAQDTIEMDDEVDALHHSISKGLQSCCSGKVFTEQHMTDALSINSMAYNIERIGDNATNIAEAAIYLMEGKNIKHHDGKGENIQQTGSES